MIDPAGRGVAHDPAVAQERVRRRPKIHCGQPNSAGAGCTDLRVRRRARVRGSTGRCDRSPSRARRRGSTSAARSTPRRRDRPHAGLASPSVPSAARSATNSSVPSHGIQGRSHVRKQSVVPSGEIAGIGVEVAARRDHPRLRRAVGRDRDELVQDVLGHALADVPFAHAEPPCAVGRDAPVREPMRAARLRRDRDRLARAGRVPVQPLIVEVREEHDAAVHDERAAAVLVDPRADVEAGRHHVGRRAERVARGPARPAPPPPAGSRSSRPTPRPSRRSPRRTEAEASIAGVIGEDQAPCGATCGSVTAAAGRRPRG